MLARSPAIAGLVLLFACSEASPPAAPAGPAASRPTTAAAGSCCAGDHAPLAPLPADATEKERWLRRIHDQASQDPQDIYHSTRYIAVMRQQLRELPPDAPLNKRFGVRWGLSLALVRTGDLDEAIALCHECVALAEAHPEEARGWLPEVLFRLAAAHFRQAERSNCIARHNADSCIFPLSERAVHVETQGAEAACKVLDRLLVTPGSDLRLEATWLLNISHMALGTWPEGVAAAHRIPRNALAPEASLPRFVDRGRELGLARHSRAGSVAIDDFTGDGRLDVLTCAFDTDAPLRLCRNEGDGRFADVTAAAGLERQLGGINLVQADVDNDGRLDVLVLRGGGVFGAHQHPPSLLRQDRPGHFVDVTQAAGIEIAAPMRTAAFADVDRDGDLDLFVGCESDAGGTGGGLRFPSRLFLNQGQCKFVESERSGIHNPHRCVAAVFGDVDADGDPDLFLSNFLAPNRLFVNQGDGTFADEAQARGVVKPEASGPAGFFDFDQDGDLDLFVTYSHHYRQIRAVAAWYIDKQVEDEAQRLFENDGKGTFRDVTEARGMKRVLMATGLNFGDVDNDGWADVYVATGAHDLAALFPNVLLLGGAKFRDATFAAGVGHLQKGNGVAFADLDDDGDLDLTCQVGGFYQDDGFGDVLFENPGGGGRWLALEVRGVTDNRSAIGARVRVRVATPEGERDRFATVGSGAATGCNPLRVHLGLGKAERVVLAEIAWPRSGATQRVEGLQLDRAVRVTQGVAGFEDLSRPPVRLGGPTK